MDIIRIIVMSIGIGIILIFAGIMLFLTQSTLDVWVKILIILIGIGLICCGCYLIVKARD